MKSESLSQLYNLLIRTIDIAKFKILHNCAIEKIGTLWDKRNMVSETKLQIFKIETVDHNLSLVGIIQSKNKIEDWSLTDPTPPHNSCKWILLDFEI